MRSLLRGGSRCIGDVDLGVGLLSFLWPGAELGCEASRRVGGHPEYCFRCVGLYVLPAAAVVCCPSVSLNTLCLCCHLVRAVWKSAGCVAWLSRADLCVWCPSQVPSGLGALPLSVVHLCLYMVEAGRSKLSDTHDTIL